jgi:hypothetical protein
MAICNASDGKSARIRRATRFHNAQAQRCIAARIPHYEISYHILKIKITAGKMRPLHIKHSEIRNKIPATAV